MIDKRADYKSAYTLQFVNKNVGLNLRPQMIGEGFARFGGESFYAPIARKIVVSFVLATKRSYASTCAATMHSHQESRWRASAR